VAGVFRAAERDRLIIATPCVDVRLPKREPKRVDPLATERVEALIAAIPERYRALVVPAAGTGLRQGEAFGVEVEAIDWLRRTLKVRQQLVLMPGREPYIAPLKAPASYRTVPLPRRRYIYSASSSMFWKATAPVWVCRPMKLCASGRLGSPRPACWLSNWVTWTSLSLTV
jgi:integrase